MISVVITALLVALALADRVIVRDEMHSPGRRDG